MNVMPTPLTAETFDPQKYLRTLQRRWPVALLTAATVIALAAVAAATRRPTYAASGQLLIESDRQSSLTGVGGKIGTLESLKREATPLDTQAIVLRSSPLRSQVIEQLQLRNAQGQPLVPTALPVEVEVMVGTDVLQVKFQDANADRAAAVVNQLMAVYIAQNRRLNTGEAAEAKRLIEQELPPAQAELARAAQALQQYRATNQIVVLDQEANGTVDQLQQLTQQIQQTQTQLADARAQQATLRAQITQTPPQALQSAALSQTPAIQTALTDLRQAQIKLDVERTKYRSTHPTVQQLEQEVATRSANLQQRIREVTPDARPVTAGQLQVSPLEQKLITDAAQLQVRQDGLEQQLTALQSMQAGYTDRRQAFPQLLKQETDLKQQFDLAQKHYNSLQSKVSEIRLAAIQSVANARVIQPAVPALTPSYQARNLILLAGVGAGLCGGIAAAFLADLVDRRLNTTDEIRAMLPYPLLGLIPRFSAAAFGPKVMADSAPAPFIPEAFRMLQTNLKFLNPDARSQTIVVSSTLPHEGKSTISAHLAATLAQSGQRVLLIDADLRSPTQQHLWDLVNGTGLSHWVVNAATAESVVQPVMDNLDIMTAGVMPPNATTFLESAAFRDHLKALAPRYDYVLIDAPPLLGSADAVILSKIADGLLLVARLGGVDDRSARAVQELLHRSGATIFGLVVNHVNLKRDGSSLFPFFRRAHNPEYACPKG
jgi:succinoglycan biosynthesis transport protein ExoP